jgi:hypothetical protein
MTIQELMARVGGQILANKARATVYKRTIFCFNKNMATLKKEPRLADFQLYIKLFDIHNNSPIIIIVLFRD